MVQLTAPSMAPKRFAIKTLIDFDAVVSRDGGNLYRQKLQEVLPHIGDAYRQEDDAFRTHMGASSIGRKCAREVWYSFHWATKPNHSGRMLRLFNRGHLEEARFIALLLAIGCTVYQQDADGNQYRISAHGGHYGGAGDGVFQGCPDLPPGTFALSEFKTHNDKSFTKLAGANWLDYLYAQAHPPALGSARAPAFTGEGLQAAKPEHYVQMQQYMRHMGLEVGVYFAVNKNDDAMYAEIILLDSESADRYTHRAIQIIEAGTTPPPRISETSSAFDCKFCDHKPVCHLAVKPAVNCRTCMWSNARPDGKWYCDNTSIADGTYTLAVEDYLSIVGVPLSKARQLTGCSMWAKNTEAFK